MKQRKIRWICIVTAVSMLMAGTVPALAGENEPYAAAVSDAGESTDMQDTYVETEQIPVIAEEEQTAETMEVAASAENAVEAESVKNVEEAGDTEEVSESVEAEEKPEAVGTEEKSEAVEAEEKSEAAEAEEAIESEELLKAEEETPVVSYCTHVQTYGWQDWKQDGAASGTSGESKRLEGIKIKVEGVEDLGISYCTHVQTYGWQTYVSDGEMSGTEKQSKRLEAIRIKLTGEKAADYDVYYCVHVQSYGWLNWAKNDEVAGTAGYSKRLEGICIKIVPKGDPAPANLGSHIGAALFGNIEYSTHVQTYGWQGYVHDGAVSGTTGESKRLEGIRIRLANTSLTGFVQYRTHVQTYGWQTNPYWSANDKMSGTEGESKRLEAIQIRLWGDIEKEYDIWYRTHVQKYGWTGWAKNGTACGSEGISYRLEGIQIMLLPKGSPAPGSTENFLYTKPVEEALGDEILTMAYQYVNSITNDSMTKEQKLRIAFDSFRTKVELNPFGAVYTGYDWPRKYARYFFTTQTGDCIGFAAAFAYMAKAIGYTNVYAVNSTGHGWAEINGLIYDPEWSLHSSEYYGISYSFVPHYQAVLNYANAENGLRQKI